MLIAFHEIKMHLRSDFDLFVDAFTGWAPTESILFYYQKRKRKRKKWKSNMEFSIALQEFSHPHKFMDGNLEYIKNCAQPFNVHHKRTNMRKAYNAWNRVKNRTKEEETLLKHIIMLVSSVKVKKRVLFLFFQHFYVAFLDYNVVVSTKRFYKSTIIHSHS